MTTARRSGLPQTASLKPARAPACRHDKVVEQDAFTAWGYEGHAGFSHPAKARSKLLRWQMYPKDNNASLLPVLTS